MTAQPIEDDQVRLRDVATWVRDRHERVVLTDHGEPVAVVLALDDLESLEETLAVMSNPELRAQIAESEAGFARGEDMGPEQLAEMLEERRRQERE